jgi:hypothetical protein
MHSILLLLIGNALHAFTFVLAAHAIKKAGLNVTEAVFGVSLDITLILSMESEEESISLLVLN